MRSEAGILQYARTLLLLRALSLQHSSKLCQAPMEEVRCHQTVLAVQTFQPFGSNLYALASHSWRSPKFEGHRSTGYLHELCMLCSQRVFVCVCRMPLWQAWWILDVTLTHASTTCKCTVPAPTHACHHLLEGAVKLCGLRCLRGTQHQQLLQDLSSDSIS